MPIIIKVPEPVEGPVLFESAFSYAESSISTGSTTLLISIGQQNNEKPMKNV